MYSFPKAITFDCYGTLIDWEGEIQQFFAQRLAMKGRGDVDAGVLQRYWEAVQFNYIQEQYRPYREVLRNTMTMTFDQFNLPYTDDDVEAFTSSMGSWKPFDDTRAALRELRHYVKIALITNTDDAIIAQTEQLLGVRFDEIVTAEQAGAYKPSQKGFLLAQERLGLPIQDIWHAGFGFKYDVVPATELGYTTVWINRQGEARPSHVKETFMVGDMRTLVYLVKGLAAGI